MAEKAETMAVSIAPKQAQIITGLQAELEGAQQRLALVLESVAAGHGTTADKIISLDVGTNTLTIAK